MEKNTQQPEAVSPEQDLETWVKPEILSFKPVEAAEGINFHPSDGLSNLTA